VNQIYESCHADVPKFVPNFRSVVLVVGPSGNHRSV